MSPDELRWRAEQALEASQYGAAMPTTLDAQLLVHELQVHQIELEMQNEALREARDELEVSREQYRELFERAPAGYILLDGQRVIVRANAAATSLLCAPGQKLIGNSLAAFAADHEVARLQRALSDAQCDGSALCVVRMRESGTTTRDLRFDMRSVQHPSPACLIVLTDVTERQRNFEARIAQLEAELEVRTRIERQRRDQELRLRERERFESLTTFAVGLAHNFNNLLVTVLGNTELLMLELGVPEAWRQPLDDIKAAGSKASELTRQMVMFTGRARMRVQRMGLSDVVTQSMSLLRARIPPAVDVRTQFTELAPIDADRSQLLEAVSQLIVNASEAVGERGSIVIECRSEQLTEETLATFQHRSGVEPGLFAVVQVRDSGIGIDRAHQHRVFEPFFTTKGAGRGLGLATVLGVVQGHRGAVRVQSEPGVGTTFEIALPTSARASVSP